MQIRIKGWIWGSSSMLQDFLNFSTFCLNFTGTIAWILMKNRQIWVAGYKKVTVSSRCFEQAFEY